MHDSRLSIGVAALAAALAVPVGAADAVPEPGRPVGRLSVQPATASEADALRARLDGRALGSSPAALGGARLAEGGAVVVAADPGLGMVVLDAGGRQGVRAGMVLTVLRDRRALARVRVTDVRRRIAGAVVEEVLPGSPYPGPGDRLVVTTDGE